MERCAWSTLSVCGGDEETLLQREVSDGWNKQSVANLQPTYIMSSSDSSAGLTRLMKAESDAQKIIEDARNSTSSKC